MSQNVIPIPFLGSAPVFKFPCYIYLASKCNPFGCFSYMSDIMYYHMPIISMKFLHVFLSLKSFQDKKANLVLVFHADCQTSMS